MTGTNGKTTTAFLLYAILAAAGRRPGLLGTIESRVGGERRPAIRTTPEAIDLQRTFREMLDAGDRSCAMEATSHGSELRRLDRVRFSALVFTNLSQDHLDFHGTMERYFEAKRRLFVGARARPRRSTSATSTGRRLAADRAATPLTFGFADDAEIGVRTPSTGSSSKLRGRFNVENVLGAVAAGAPARHRRRGDRARARVACAGCPAASSRSTRGSRSTVIVDYAHKPDALENVLRTARELTSGRLICVFGCGGDRDRGKRPLMGRIASELADVAIVTSDNPRSEDPQAIIDEILAGAKGDVEVEPDRRAAIERALAEARATATSS